MELELEAMADTLGPAWTPARATAWWQTHARSAVGAAVAFDQADTARDASDTSHPSSPEDPRAPTDAGDAGGLASTVPS